MMTPELALTLIEHAVHAPSSHNTQPWRFRLADSAIDLFADRTRALPVNDPHDRELTISCGAALMNLRIAAAHANLATSVAAFPDPDDPDWLARMAVRPSPASCAPEAELFDSITTRRTYRKRFRPQPVDADVVSRLAAAASAERARLVPIASDTDRHAIADLVREGDARQWADPSWRRELAAWMHARRRGDGLTLPGLAVPVARLVVRTFDIGGGVAAKDRDLAEASPLLAVLETSGDEPEDWLVAGQALERVLLTACTLGLQASYLNQPIQDSALRPQVRARVGAGGCPQILLRMGYPDATAPRAPRRAVHAVIDEAAAQLLP